MKVDVHSKIKSVYKFIFSHDWALSILLTVILVLVSIIEVNIAHPFLALNSDPVSRYLQDNNLLSQFANWDGVRYIQIASRGYYDSFVTGFFPLYPILIALLQKIIGSYIISGLIISWLALSGAIFYYLKIIKLYFKTTNLGALKACLVFVLFPSAIYLVCVYTESLYAFLALGAIYSALNKKYLRAGIFTGFAAATHITAPFLVILIGLMLLEEKIKLRKVILSMIIGSLGLLAYMDYLWKNFKNPLEFLEAQKIHGWLHQTLFQRIGQVNLIEWAFVIVILWTIIYWWKRKKSFAVYSYLYLTIPLVGGQFGGFPRYCLMIFPIQFMIFDYFRKKPELLRIILAFFFLIWSWILILFTSGYVVS